jgi:hypothetical protein
VYLWRKASKNGKSCPGQMNDRATVAESSHLISTFSDCGGQSAFDPHDRFSCEVLSARPALDTGLLFAVITNPGQFGDCRRNYSTMARNWSGWKVRLLLLGDAKSAIGYAQDFSLSHEGNNRREKIERAVTLVML